MKTFTWSVVAAGILSALGAHAESIRLADGTVLEGQLAEPAEVKVQTAAGDRKVPFALLPSELQRIYWRKPARIENALPVASAVSVDDEQIAELANEVNLQTWSQVAAIGSFRDKPEKRGPGGLIVTKAFNALEENWVSVYSPKDSVGQAGHWDAQLARARALQQRTQQFLQQRWLSLFVRAGEAVARRDSNDFAQAVRELTRSPILLAARPSPASAQNFFTAK